MRSPDLIEGARYILSVNNQVAVYEGRHDGALILADGATYYGGRGALRFRFTDAEGVERIALLQTGAEVSESEATRIERERLAAAKQVRRDAAEREAKTFLTGLGFEIAKNTWDARDAERGVALGHLEEDANKIQVEGITIGKLKAALAAIRTVEPA